MAFDWESMFSGIQSSLSLQQTLDLEFALLIMFARVVRGNKSDLGEFANPGMSNVFTRTNGPDWPR